MLRINNARRALFTSRKELRVIRRRMEPVYVDATGDVIAFLLAVLGVAALTLLAFLPGVGEWFLRWRPW